MPDTVTGGASAHRPEDDPLTARVVEIWCEVLRIGGMTADDPLPDLGTRSILVIEVALRVQRELGVDLPLEAFVVSETVRDLARVVRDIQQEQAVP
jgi:acyl carrier protein